MDNNSRLFSEVLAGCAKMDRYEPNSQELLNRVTAGDSVANTTVFDRYVKRLVALARQRIGPKLQQRIDPEDVVQSAYRSFFIHAQNEEYVWRRAGDLWRLLTSITLHKLYGQIEWHTAARRDVARDDSARSASGILPVDPIDREPTPDVAAALTEQLKLVLSKFDPSEQFVLSARLQGQTVEEISLLLHRSQRTVRRLLAQGQRRLEDLALAD